MVSYHECLQLLAGSEEFQHFHDFHRNILWQNYKQKVDYQYQLWKIKPESVCINKKNELINEYSSCTNAAKAMFQDTFEHLNKNPQSHWKYSKLKNMYCTAAVSYTPIIATISRPTEAEAEVWEAKQQCSLLTLEARQSSKPGIDKKRKLACDNARKVIEKYN